MLRGIIDNVQLIPENRDVLHSEERAYELTTQLYQLLQEEHGAQAKACRLAKRNKNYFAECAERGSIDLRALLAALEALEMHPAVFFEAYFPASLSGLAKGRL